MTQFNQQQMDIIEAYREEYVDHPADFWPYQTAEGTVIIGQSYDRWSAEKVYYGRLFQLNMDGTTRTIKQFPVNFKCGNVDNRRQLIYAQNVQGKY